MRPNFRHQCSRNGCTDSKLLSECLREDRSSVVLPVVGVCAASTLNEPLIEIDSSAGQYSHKFAVIEFPRVRTVSHRHYRRGCEPLWSRSSGWGAQHS